MIFQIWDPSWWDVCDRNRRVKKTRKVLERPDSKAAHRIFWHSEFVKFTEIHS